MILARRAFLIGTAALLLPRQGRAAGASIRMVAAPDGSDVWFDPIGLWVAPGTEITWLNADPGNSHTATSSRIPAGAAPWDSGYLMPDARFSVRLEREGVYDYFCRPHQMAGMVGRIVVGQPGVSTPDDRLPTAERIVAERVVRRA